MTGSLMLEASAREVAGRRYRIRKLTLPVVLSDMWFEPGSPGPGDLVPQFDLANLSGGRVCSDRLGEIGPLLIIFGSLTCPMTDSAVPGLIELQKLFGEQVRFLLVDVREAHPGAKLPQPETMEEKVARAQLLREFHSLPFDVAVDDIDGSFHRALGPKPNSAYLIDTDGYIRFRAHWANDTDALFQALDALTNHRVAARRQSRGLLKAMMRMLGKLPAVLDRSGDGAWSDMWRVMPLIAVLALTFQYFGMSRTSAPRATDTARLGRK